MKSWSWLDGWGRGHGEQAGDEAPSDPEIARLLERARGLPLSQEPTRDLWSGIENRITGRAEIPKASGREARRWSPGVLFPRPIVAAAAAVMLVVMTAGTTYWLTLRPAAPLGDVEVAAIAERLRERDGVADVRESLVAILAARRAQLPAATVDALDESLRSIDRAIAEIHLALMSHPDRPGLSFMLAEAYRREADLLEQLEWWMRAPHEVSS